MKIARIILTVVAVTGIVGSTWAQQTLLPGHTAILTGIAAHSLFRQCSRSSPTVSEGYWNPSAQSIKQIETTLPGYLYQQKLPAGASAKYLCGYYFQCAGFLRKKHHIIYINAFSPSTKDSMAHEINQTTKKPFDWKKEPVIVCDGGDSFYGIEYDVEARTFSNLDFNGRG